MQGASSCNLPRWPTVLAVVAGAVGPAARGDEASMCPADLQFRELYFFDAYRLAECRVLLRRREGTPRILAGPSPPSRALTAAVDKQLATFSDAEWSRLSDGSWQSAPPPAEAAAAAASHPLLLAAGAGREPADDSDEDYEFELGGYRVRASALGRGALGDVWRARIAAPADEAAPVASGRPHVVLKRLRDVGPLIRRSGLREVFFGGVLAGEGGAALLDAFERRCLWSARTPSPHRGSGGADSVTKSPDCTVHAPEDVASVMERARARAAAAGGAGGVPAPVVSVTGRWGSDEEASAPLARPRGTWLRRALARITTAVGGIRDALAGGGRAGTGKAAAGTSLAFRLRACGPVPASELGLPPPLRPLPAPPPLERARRHPWSVAGPSGRGVRYEQGSRWLPDAAAEQEEEEEGSETRELWLVMEDAGTSLRQLFTAVAPSGVTQPSPLSEAAHREGWSSAAALTLARALFTALAACHARGVLHRDVKPANVLLAVERGTDDGSAPEAVPSPTLAHWRAALTAAMGGLYRLRLRLVDFGSALDLSDPGWLYGEAGPSVAEATDDYVPPEVFAAPGADCARDDGVRGPSDCRPPEPFAAGHPEVRQRQVLRPALPPSSPCPSTLAGPMGMAFQAYDVWSAALTVLEAFYGRGLDVDARTLARLMRAMPASLRADPVAQRRWRVAMALAEMGVLASPAGAAEAGAGGSNGDAGARAAPDWALDRLYHALRRRDPWGRGIDHAGLLAALWGALQWNPANRWSAQRIVRSLAPLEGG